MKPLPLYTTWPLTSACIAASCVTITALVRSLIANYKASQHV